MPSSDPKSATRHLFVSDLRGLAQLAAQATRGVVGIVEGVHRSVQRTVLLETDDGDPRARGIAGMVYRTLDGAARVIGEGLGSLLAGLEPMIGVGATRADASFERDAVIAALNGVMGDQLAASGSPFATPMTLRYRGEPLDAVRWSSAAPAGGRIVLLVHGLCMNDRQWRRAVDGTLGGATHADHGATVAAALGYTPVYARYNSGLHISDNGRALAAAIERMIARWPAPVTEISIVAHSMGGLVARSAFDHALRKGAPWRRLLRHLVFLGTPHHGAPLERAGNWVDTLLAGTRFTAPFAKLGQLRSAGITDLRHGSISEEDWHRRDRFARAPVSHRHVPLPEGVACHAIAATTAARRGAIADRLIGDGLVPLRSALGQHDDRARRLAFARTSQWIAYGTNHLDLLDDPRVADKIVAWLA
jgi:hypothetical protein